MFQQIQRYGFDQEGNDQTYAFWRNTILERLQDPEKQRLLATEKRRHPFGTKRISLQRRFYQVVGQDHGGIISVNEIPIEEAEENGPRTKKDLTKVDVR